MNKIYLIILAVILVAVSGYCQETMQAPEKFGGIVAGVGSMSALVEAIDTNTRAVTLKTDDGKEVKVICGPEVRNFEQIQKGDKVNIDYSQKVQIVVSGVSSAPQKQESLEVSRAPLGEKPAGVMTSTTQILATVEAINYEKRMVTLRGPERTLEVEVTGDAPNFDKIKIGDTVYVEYVEQVAISVTK